jgi:hypothetical protein
VICSTFLAQIGDRVDNLIGRARLAVRSIDERQLNQVPQPGSWSIGQIFDHMRIGNELYLASMTRAVDGASYGRDTEVKFTIIGRLIIKAAGPTGNVPVPRLMTPGNGPFEANVLDAFVAQHEEFKELARRSESVDLNKQKLANPIAPIVRISLADAFEICLQHSDRHLRQIETIERGLRA